MLDASNRSLTSEALQEFLRVTRIPELKDLPMLILASKCDLEDAMSITEIKHRMDLNVMDNIKV